MQPDLGTTPVASHRDRRDLEHRGSFVDAEATKEPHFDDLHLAGIDARERIQCVIERDEVEVIISAHHDDRFVERDMPHAATALDVVASRMLNKDAPHQLRADGEKMRTILPLHPGVIHQSHIRFIDQSGCLEAVARTFTSHIAMGEAMELRVDDWCQLIKGALISLGPGLQQLCDNGRASLSVLRRPHRCWILLPLLNKGGKSDHSAPPSGTHR